MGWPPVKCAHRRNGGGYVKVKMEGVAIGRKVDLSLHSSYEELLDTLGRMFPSTNQGMEMCQLCAYCVLQKPCSSSYPLPSCMYKHT